MYMYHRQQKGDPKGVYLPISKLHSLLAVANLIALNNISQICNCCQISSLSVAINCSFSDNLMPLGGNIYFIGCGNYITLCSNIEDQFLYGE